MTLHSIEKGARWEERERKRGGFGLTSELNKDAVDTLASDNVSLKYFP